MRRGTRTTWRPRSSRVRLVDVEPERLSAALRSRPPEAGGGCEDDRGVTVVDDLELPALGDGALVHVAAENELDSCGRKALEHEVAPADGTLVRGAPGRRRKVMMERGRPQHPGGSSSELGRETLELRRLERAALLTPRPHRVQADDRQALRRVDGLGRPEDTFPLHTRLREACRERVRNVVVSRDREEGEPEAPEQLVRALELGPTAAVSEVAGDDEDLGLEPGNQLAEGREGLGLLAPAEMQIGDVEDPSCHGRGTIAPSSTRSGSGKHSGRSSPRRPATSLPARRR